MGTRTAKIGILSDTHGQSEMAERAAAVLARHSPELVFHCGDIGGEAVINALLSLPMVYVFGNVDDDRAGLRRYIAALGAACEEPFAERELAGRRIAAIHGHNEHQLRDLVESQRYDYLLHGHTHVLRDPTRGGLATTLNEIAAQSKVCILLDEKTIPIQPAVRAASEMLGFDPLYIANEGKVIVIVPPEEAEPALAALQSHPYGRNAALIGRVQPDPAGRVLLRTAIGGTRILDMLAGEMLPRIC